MRLFMLLTTACLLVGGCVTGPGYDHPTATVPEKQRDVVECQALAVQGSQNVGDRTGVVTEMRRQALLQMCLESRGWVPTAAPGPSKTEREQPSSEHPLHRCALKPTLSRRHDLEEEQLRWRRDVGHSTVG